MIDKGEAQDSYDYAEQGEEQEAEAPPAKEVWIECFDPRNEETYYYCHATEESILEPPDEFLSAEEDDVMRSVIKIQCLGRKRIARHKLQRARFKQFKNAAFTPDFSAGPAMILSAGMTIRRLSTEEENSITATAGPLLALVAAKAMTFGKHYFIFQVGQHTASSVCDVGICPYMLPAVLKMSFPSSRLRDIPGSWAFTSKGEIFRDSQKVEATWMESFGQGDVIGIALDYDEHKIAVSRNAMYLGDISIAGIRRLDLVPALSLTGDGSNDVSFQWCQKPPYEQFSTTDLDSLSSSESVEVVLRKYKVRGSNKKEPVDDGTLAAESSSIASIAQSDAEDGQSFATIPRPKDLNEQMIDDAKMIMSTLLAERQRKDQQMEAIKARAVTYKTNSEAEAKKREAEEKRARQERKAALHRIPNSMERKLAEKRRRKKYMALQMQRYKAARKKFLDKLEKRGKEEADKAAQEIARKKEAAMRKKEVEDEEAAKKGPNVQTIFDACRSGVPIWRLQELLTREVQRLESRESKRHNNTYDDDNNNHEEGEHQLDIFDQFCNSVESGYVMESSHPYSSADEIDQCMEVAMDEPLQMGGANEKSTRWGICIAFDPRSDTRAGDGHISFLVEDQEDANASTPIHDIKSVSLLFRPQGIELNLQQKHRPQKSHSHGPKEVNDNKNNTEEGSSPRLEGVWFDEELDLPGVNGCPPLFLPTNRFIIRFKAAPWDASEEAMGWGWRMVAFPAQSQEHGQALLMQSIQASKMHSVLSRHDARGDTPLHIAAWENNVPAINYLVKEGADIGAIDSVRTKVTPLHCAAMAGHLPAVKRILELGGNVMSKTSSGDLPLHEACRAGHTLVARRLVKAERRDPLMTVRTRNVRGHLPHQAIPRDEGRFSLLYYAIKDYAEGRARYIPPRRRQKKVTSKQPARKVAGVCHKKSSVLAAS